MSNVKMKPVLLVGFSSCRDVTGLALAFDLLLAGFTQCKQPYRLVDFGRLGLADKPGTFNLGRIWGTIWMLLLFCSQLGGVRSVYILIASSKFGFIRDAFMIWASRIFRHRLVLHLNGGGYRSFYEDQAKWMQWIIARTISQADAIVVLGEQLRDQFAFVDNPEKKVSVVPNGLPLELEPEIDSIQNGWTKSLPKEEPVRLLYLSNMQESKGYLALLEACAILVQEKNLNIHCDFCGKFVETIADKKVNNGAISEEKQGSAESKFYQLVDDWGLQDHVTFHGLVRKQQKETFLRQAHALILPTTYPWEGQPICIIEALAFQTPVIATALAGIPEQIIHGYNGFLAKAEPEKIADAIEKMISDPDFYKTLSRNARLHFESNFTREIYLDKLIPTILGNW